MLQNLLHLQHCKRSLRFLFPIIFRLLPIDSPNVLKSAYFNIWLFLWYTQIDLTEIVKGVTNHKVSNISRTLGVVIWGYRVVRAFLKISFPVSRNTIIIWLFKYSRKRNEFMLFSHKYSSATHIMKWKDFEGDIQIFYKISLNPNLMIQKIKIWWNFSQTFHRKSVFFFI